MGGFWFTSIMLALYLFHVIEKFYKIPWLKIELGFCTLWTFFYLLAACLAATFGVEAFAAAAVNIIIFNKYTTVLIYRKISFSKTVNDNK